MRTVKLALAIGLSALGLLAFAQDADYPSKPIRLVIGFAPGGAADEFLAQDGKVWVDLVKSAKVKVD